MSAYSSYSATTIWPRRCRFGCCYLEFLLGRLRRVRDSISKRMIRSPLSTLVVYAVNVALYGGLANLLLGHGRRIIHSRK